MAKIPAYGTFQHRCQPSDVEAAFHLSNNSAAKDSSSSAREEIPLSDQANVRRRVTKKASDKRPDRKETDFFEKFQQKWENAQYHHCLFLCCEKGSRDQRTVPVLVQDPEDERQIYMDLSRTWYEKYGWWSRYVPFYGITSLDEVEVFTRMVILSPLTGNKTVSLLKRAR